MKRHLLKLMWHRKRSNALVVAEIFVSFLVLFVLVAFAAYFASNYRKPLGYDIAGIWRLELGMHQAGGGEEEVRSRYATVLAELDRMPEIRSTAAIAYPPYFMGVNEWNMGMRDGRAVTVQTNDATDGLDAVLDLELVDGRWFTAADDGLNWQPIVVDRELAIAAFGRADVAGERAYFLEERGDHRIVGVIDDFRRGGELSGESPYLFFRARRDGTGNPAPHVLLDMRPGVDAAFEEELVRRLAAIAPDWSFAVESLERERASALRLQMIPLVLCGIVAGFLILMVALGLTGVMWQTVTRRTRELGLRRAVGSGRAGLYRQIVFETIILAAGGILLGVVVAAQLPLIGFAAFLGTGIYVAAILMTSGAIVLLAVACGLYPGWLASRIQPADALRYE